MKTGMQFTKPHPAARACSAYHSVARWLPTGRKFTTMSVCVSWRIRATSAGGSGASTTTSDSGSHPVERGATVDGHLQAGDIREPDRVVGWSQDRLGDVLTHLPRVDVERG